MQSGEYGVLAQVFQALGTGRGEPGQCLQQWLDRGFALMLDRLGAAVGEPALVTLDATGADRQHRAGDATRLPAQLGQQLLALDRAPLVGLVQHQQQRLAEIREPAQFAGLAAVEVAGAQIDHRVRAQGFLARQRFAGFAAALVAAGHIRQHQAAAIG
jgi:hypothetical protein